MQPDFKITIEVNNQIKVPYQFKTLFEIVALAAMKKIKLKNNLHISVTLVSSLEIKKINQLYRRINQPTDVLSFPEINEVLICFDRVKSDARQAKKSVKYQLAWVFCHGLLHLLGYNHHRIKEAAIMHAQEGLILGNIK